MNIFIFILMILINSVLLSSYFKKDISQSILVVFLGLLLYLYIFGLLDLLAYANGVFYIITIISLLSNIFLIYKNKTILKKYILKPALLYMLILLVASLVLFSNRYVAEWDEFTQWGLYPKNIFIYQKMFSMDFTSVANGYPPITGLLHNFILSIGGVFKENDLFRSIFLFSSIPLVFCLKNTSFKQPLKMLFTMFVIAFLPLAFFTNYLGSLYVDALLAVLFAAAIIRLIYYKVSIRNFAIIFTLSSLLILTKEFGLILAACIYGGLFLDALYFSKKEYKTFYKSIKKDKKFHFVTLFILFLLPLLAKLSWQLYVSNNIGTSTQISQLSFHIPPYFGTVFSNFISTVFNEGLQVSTKFLNVPAFTWMIIFVSFLLLVYNFTSEEKTKLRFKYAILGIVLSFMLYCAMLLFSYLFLFSEYEALYLASYGRYILTILLACLFIVIILVILYDQKNIFKSNLPYLSAVIMVLLFTNIFPIVMQGANYFQNFSKNDNLYRIEGNVEYIRKIIGDNQRIYYVNQEPNGEHGYDYWAFRYYLTPLKVQHMAWSIGEPISKDDVWTVKMNSNEWKKELQNYDYVYLDHINESFITNFKSCFTESGFKDGAIYKVNKDTLLLDFYKDVNLNK